MCGWSPSRGSDQRVGVCVKTRGTSGHVPRQSRDSKIVSRASNLRSAAPTETGTTCYWGSRQTHGDTPRSKSQASWVSQTGVPGFEFCR